MPPWPLGLTARRPGASSKIRPLAASTAGIVPWQKIVQVVFGQPEAVVRGRGNRRSRRASPGWSSGRAGSARRAAGPRPGSSRCGSETATGRTRGPIGNMPLGWSNPRRVPCPPATRMTPTSAGGQRLVAAAADLLRREAIRDGVQSEGRRRARPLGQRADVALLVAPFDTAAPARSRSTRADLPAQRLARRLVQCVPEGQQLLLAVAAQQGFDFFLHRRSIRGSGPRRPSSRGFRRLAAR